MATRRESTARIPRLGDGAVLRPPASLRDLAWVLACLALLLVTLTIFLFVREVLVPACGFAMLAALLVIVVTPIVSGRVTVRAGELYTRADPVKAYTLPWREISALETRRRLLTEVVAIRRGDAWVELGAPRRWRFRPDPAFTTAVEDLAQRAAVAPARGGRRTPVARLVLRTVLAIAYVVLFVKIDPLWHSSVWPGRLEATAVPDACSVIARDATVLEGTKRPRHLTDHNPGMISSDDCSYGGALTLRYELRRYAIGQDGGREQARREYRDWVAAHPADANAARRPVPGLGDEALVLVSAHPDGKAHLVVLAARRANVTVELNYEPRAGRLGGTSVAAATATAERLAHAAVERIIVR